MKDINKIFSEELYFDPLGRDIARLNKNAINLIESTNKVEHPLPKELWFDILSIVGDYDIFDVGSICVGNMNMQIPTFLTTVDNYRDDLLEQIEDICNKYSTSEITFVLHTGYYHSLLQTTPPKMFTLIGGFFLY
jgi:hypothetical protein